MSKIFVQFFVYLILINGLTGCGDNSTEPSQNDKLLLISFDGFRYNYLEKVETLRFDTLVSEGVRAEGLIPVFPSKTFPNHYAIATGLYPENSGFVNNTMYDPEWEEWYRIRDREAVEDGKWYGGEPIWNTLEKQGIKTGTMFWIGSEADIQGMHPTHWKRYNDDMPHKARVDTVVKWLSDSEEEDVDFATLYFSHLDTQGHRYGTKSDSLEVAIREADRIMGYLKEQLQDSGLWDRTNILVVSDHGMIDLSEEKIIDLDKIVNMDDIERIIWGPLTMIQPESGKETEIFEALKAQEEFYRVYKKENIPDRYHIKNSRRVSDIVLIADLGYTILDSKNREQFIKSLPRGTHGYDPNKKAMHAFFLAHGPAFKKDTTVEAFQNIHLYELMNELMGTEPAPNDGSLDSVRVLLK
ncbi:ectonucleotide pyrophosphatase/phosphodiesterase [Aliifodinibius salicampi]|uniref:Ectonucleotide pyrophosphatase/phosphodiesterase n=1 Tax=Fodinibius salicampi TaxID=1920655 RepID=A0ABT3PYC4_9BACT|nr:ectonucleotide pyrophosphatase/phosphodiesterase [Fodinibius salicampi]MCW9712870.1 ectonucleotide pyrophosphatase/phosphodiesterase [Fodinibius salicampi]